MSMFTRDEIVLQLRGQGIPLHLAERAADRELAGASASSIVAAQPLGRDAAIAELDEQREIRRTALALGFRVYWLSQARKTKQTPGLPDLWLAHDVRQLCAWWETKRQVGGARSTAQDEFARSCELAGVPYGFGDRYAFDAWLRAHRFEPPVRP